MVELFIILKDILLPIFIIMGIGFVMQKKFDLILQTLARLNIYFVVPGFIFVKLHSTQISANLFGHIFLFFILYVVVFYVYLILWEKSIKMEKGEKTTFSNSVMFFNSGNYGVPVNDLVFKSDPLAMSIQVIMLTLQNIFLIFIRYFFSSIYQSRKIESSTWLF